MLPLRARGELRAMAMKRYTAFPEATASLGPHHQIVECLVWGGAHGVMVIVVGNGHGDTSSNPERGRLHFT